MFGDRLKELREDSGMSQEKLSKILGVSRGAITNYETNTHMPKIEILIKIADIFNVSLDYLTCRTKRKNNLNLCSPEDYNFIYQLINLIKKYKK